MTYAEKMAKKIEEAWWQTDEDFYVQKYVNQIIADMKRACIQNVYAKGMWNAIYETLIMTAEIKEQPIDAVDNAVKAHMRDMEDEEVIDWAAEDRATARWLHEGE